MVVGGWPKRASGGEGVDDVAHEPVAVARWCEAMACVRTRSRSEAGRAEDAGRLCPQVGAATPTVMDYYARKNIRFTRGQDSAHVHHCSNKRAKSDRATRVEQGG